MEQSCVGHRIENVARQRMLARQWSAMNDENFNSYAGQVARQGGGSNSAPGVPNRHRMTV